MNKKKHTQAQTTRHRRLGLALWPVCHLRPRWPALACVGCCGPSLVRRSWSTVVVMVVMVVMVVVGG